MKRRMGFVSNSSSSSFLIFVDKKPESVEETKKLFLGDNTIYPDPYYDPTCAYFKGRPSGYAAIQVAEDVHKDLENQKPLTLEELAEELSSGYLPGDDENDYYSLDDRKRVKKVCGIVEPQYEDFKIEGEKWEVNWKAYEKANKEFNIKIAKIIMKKYEGKKIYRLSYADDTSYGCALEHGTLFDRVDHFCISKH